MDHLTDIQLIDYCGDRLPAPARAAVDAHLAGCEPCARRCRELDATWRVLGDWEVPDDGRDLADRVLQALGSMTDDPADSSPVIGRIGAWPVMRVAASITLAALVGYTAALVVRPSIQPAISIADPDPDQALAELYLDVMVEESPVGLSPVILPPLTPNEGV